jgi:large subunit ribosomal protein L23
MHRYEVLRRPLLSEKTQALGVLNQYAFEVALAATKVEIREAVESIFNVKVLQVRTAIMPSKDRRWGRKTVRRAGKLKKALVTLRPGDSLDVFGA